MVEPCLGAINTKESLSFGKQPSLFKGRNQSWFHPLRTPSRPGAAAPGPHGGLGAVVSAFAYPLPAALHRPPAARFYHSVVIVSRFGSKAGFCFRWWLRFRVGDPSNRPAGSVGMTVRVGSPGFQGATVLAGIQSNLAAAGLCLICHPERAARAEGSPTRNLSRQRKQHPALSPKRDTTPTEW